MTTETKTDYFTKEQGQTARFTIAIGEILSELLFLAIKPSDLLLSRQYSRGSFLLQNLLYPNI